MRRNRLMRWLAVVAVVLAVHVAIFAGLMQRRSALPVPQPNGIEVRTEMPSTATGQAGTDAKNPAAESINTASSTKPVSSSSSQTMIKNTDIENWKIISVFLRTSPEAEVLKAPFNTLSGWKPESIRAG